MVHVDCMICFGFWSGPLLKSIDCLFYFGHACQDCGHWTVRNQCTRTINWKLALLVLQLSAANCLTHIDDYMVVCVTNEH